MFVLVSVCLCKLELTVSHLLIKVCLARTIDLLLYNSLLYHPPSQVTHHRSVSLFDLASPATLRQQPQQSQLQQQKRQQQQKQKRQQQEQQEQQERQERQQQDQEESFNRYRSDSFPDKPVVWSYRKIQSVARLSVKKTHARYPVWLFMYRTCISVMTVKTNCLHRACKSKTCAC